MLNATSSQRSAHFRSPVIFRSISHESMNSTDAQVSIAWRGP